MSENRAWSWRHAIIKSGLQATTRHVLLTLGVLEHLDQTPSTTHALADACGLSERAVRSHLAIARDYGWQIDNLVAFVEDDPWHVVRAKVFAEKGSYCVYCGRDASVIDHVRPKSRGGSDAMSNLVPACVRCNWEKGARTPDEWRATS